MTDPVAGNSRESACAASNFLSLTGFIVEVADGPDGTFRPIQDRAGEPEIFPTTRCAQDVAEAWAISFRVDTRVRDLLTGEIVADGPDADEIDALWLELRRAEADEAERRDLERMRRNVQAPILERADADEALAIAAE